MKDSTRVLLARFVVQAYKIQPSAIQEAIESALKIWNHAATDDERVLAEHTLIDGLFPEPPAEWVDPQPAASDDGEPITQEWLDSLSLKIVKAAADEGIVVALLKAEPYVGLDGMTRLHIRTTYQSVDIPLPVIKTRWQLFVLLLLLGFAEEPDA
jgi:hypothetical protein